jgi:outer membrane immunogenic protein
VKKRLALAFVALGLTPAGLTPAAAPAAELAVAPLYRPVPFVPRQTVEWTGLTFGANVGYGWAKTSTSTSFFGDVPGTSAGSPFAGGVTTPFGLGATELSDVGLGGSGKASGPLAGGQVGFNWQAGWFVFGAEVDAQWSGQRGSFASACSTTGCFASDAVRIKSLLTGRARFGVAFDWILPYVTAGAALASVSDDLILTIGGVTGAFDSHTGSRLGWTAGAGVDVALTSNWSARLEYLYVAVDDITSTARIPNVLGLGSTAKGIEVRDSILRVGVNYRFGPRGGPGVIERPLLAPAGYASAYNFLPSITTYADSPIFANKAPDTKRAPAVTAIADAPQREAPIAAARGTERAPAAPAMVAGEVPQREAPIAAAGATERAPAAVAANAPKAAAPAISRFADIEDSDDSIRRTTTAAAITLPTLNKRPRADDDSRHLKRIMSICSGC